MKKINQMLKKERKSAKMAVKQRHMEKMCYRGMLIPYGSEYGTGKLKEEHLPRHFR